MEKKPKPAVKSVGMWSGAITLIGGIFAAFPQTISSVVDVLPDIVQQIVPILSPHTAGIVVAAAGIVTIINRRYGSEKPIKGIVKTPEEEF